MIFSSLIFFHISLHNFLTTRETNTEVEDVKHFKLYLMLTANFGPKYFKFVWVKASLGIDIECDPIHTNKTKIL